LTNTQLLIGGQWTAARSGETEEIRSPYDGSVVGEVSTAGLADVELAPAAAEHGAATGTACW
jgi:acyl-CoA reductase-like NAD-dependent aldehyde dehydrogenase